MNEMNDAHAYEMQCNYGSQTPEVLQLWGIPYSCKNLAKWIFLANYV
jgi:hypothetical protein